MGVSSTSTDDEVARRFCRSLSRSPSTSRERPWKRDVGVCGGDVGDSAVSPLIVAVVAPMRDKSDVVAADADAVAALAALAGRGVFVIAPMLPASM